MRAVTSGGTTIALSRSRDLRAWQHADPLVPRPVPGSVEQQENARLSPFLGIAQQAMGAGEAAASIVSNLDHPECWEDDVNDSDMCCGGPLTAPGAPADKAFVLFSPSSQGAPPHANCSHIRPALAETNFNGIATANVSLTALLASRF